MKISIKKSVLMISLVIIFCGFMAVIDGVIKVNYLEKSFIKVLLFLILPLIYSL